MKNFHLLFLLFAIFWTACQNQSGSEMRPLNLLEYGIPLTIMAPDSAKVVSGTLSFSQDVTIKSPADNYDVQLFAYDATTTDLSKVKAGQLAEVKGGAFFSKIIEEDPNGFIFETALDSATTNYGFKYVHLQADKEYVFQTGLVGLFRLEDVKKMYDAVKQ